MPNLRSTALKLVRVFDGALKLFPRIGQFQPPRGSFSAYRRLREGELTGDVLFEEQPRGECPDGSITELSGMRQHDHQPWPVFWARADEPRLVGKLLHWRNEDDRICEEGRFNLPERTRLGEDRLFAQTLVPRPKKLDGAWTSIVSNLGDGGNYFHWITDCLPRLAIREYLPERTKILIPNSSAPYVRDSLNLLGISEDCELRTEPCVQPERFYFCSPLAMTGVWNPLGFDWIRENFSPHFLPSRSGNPIFLTRRASTRIPAQLAEIEAMFSKAGFDILDCGKLTMLQQIQAASSASAIAGIHGAAMTNIIWASQGVPVLELFQPSYLNACYEQIAFQGLLDYSAIILDDREPFQKITDWVNQL